MDHFDDPVCRDPPPRFSPAPLLGGPTARSQNERSVGGLGTAMMTLSHQMREKLSAAKRRLWTIVPKNQIVHRDIDSLWRMHRIIVYQDKLNYTLTINHKFVELS